MEQKFDVLVYNKKFGLTKARFEMGYAFLLDGAVFKKCEVTKTPFLQEMNSIESEFKNLKFEYWFPGFREIETYSSFKGKTSIFGLSFLSLIQPKIDDENLFDVWLLRIGLVEPEHIIFNKDELTSLGNYLRENSIIRTWRTLYRK